MLIIDAALRTDTQVEELCHRAVQQAVHASATVKENAAYRRQYRQGVSCKNYKDWR
ncbi:hypothetical protein AAKU55_005904 [Oxalobacteraceae bacterium GrIS 1.11]